MSNPHALSTALLRPCVLQVLRAAGYHSTKPSVLDTLTGLAANYMFQLAQATADHAAFNQDNPEMALEVLIQDVRMAMQDFGCFDSEEVRSGQQTESEEDTKGVEAFIAWAKGPENQEIRRIALEGIDGAKDDYLAVLKKKHGSADEEARYAGTVLGKPAESKVVKIEGADFTSLHEWAEKLREPVAVANSSALSSRRQSSVLSSLGDESLESMEF